MNVNITIENSAVESNVSADDGCLRFSLSREDIYILVRRNHPRLKRRRVKKWTNVFWNNFLQAMPHD